MARTKQQQPESNPSLSIKSVTKSSVWDIQENDVIRMWEAACKDAEVKENVKHYLQIFKSAFFVEDLREDSAPVRKSFEARGYKVAVIKFDEAMKFVWAIKKRPISRVTDLTYENIRHITAAQLLEVIDRNFGGGWDSLSQSVQDVIQSGFDISTTTLPKDRLHKKGGMYEKKVADGYEVLEVEKGSWVEAIFAKVKPEAYKPRMKFEESIERGEDEEDDDLPVDDYNRPDEDDMEIEEPDDDEINENNYRTTFVIEDDPDADAESLSDYIEDE